jgi:hypothetical protein
LRIGKIVATFSGKIRALILEKMEKRENQWNVRDKQKTLATNINGEKISGACIKERTF